MKKINYIFYFFIVLNLFYYPYLYAGNNTYLERLYKSRVDSIKTYISTIKSENKKNSMFKGSVVESLSGRFFIQYGAGSQNQIDRKALSECKKAGGIDCEVRFRSLKINTKYNRFAKFNNSKQKLNVLGKKISSKKVWSVSGIDILQAEENYKTSANGLVCEKVKSTFHSREAIDLISKEIRVYPTSFLKKSGLKYVMICERINENKNKNVNILGFAQSHIDMSTGVFYLNLMQLTNDPEKELSIKHTFHHEFYHIIDATLSLIMLDNKWIKIAENKYDRKLWGEGNFVINNSVKGYISKYARNSVAEDKAEMFAFMIGKHKELKNISNNDEILLNKYNLMKTRLYGISSTINDNFWRNLN